MLESYSLINKGDVVELSHGGIARKFEVIMVRGQQVALGWTHDNVVQLRWIGKAALIELLYAPIKEVKS